MSRQIQGSQTDFSFGEVDVALKRADGHPARKAGLRQMANARILNSGALQNRSGRKALYPINNAVQRIEELTLSAGNIFKIEFGPGRWQIRNSAGTVLATSTTQGNGAALPWATSADFQSIVYAVLNLTITITFGHAMRPQVITWDGVATWTFSDYTEALNGNQKRTPFYRISPQGITMAPTGYANTVNLVFSAPVLTAASVGTRMRYIGRQLLITVVADSEHGTATVEEPLPFAQEITFGTGNDPTTVFSVGDVVIGTETGAKGIVTVVAGPTTDAIFVQLLQATVTLGGVVGFIPADTIVGPGGSMPAAGTGVAPAPYPVTDWDEEVINSKQGFPASCFVDQFRLGFCNFPTVPGGILWSGINNSTDIYANDASSSDNAIFELTPGKVQVYFVVPGPESSEFVFCDTRIYYIPISTTSPLAPGSVGFQLLSGDGSAQVQPRIAQEAILYANAGQNSIYAIIATGAYNKPFNTKDLSQFHEHVFNNIQCIAAPNADGTFNERYAYVLNGDGSIAVGKYQAESLQGNQPVIGWGPWSGAGVVSWVAAWNAHVVFTTKYFGVGICERLDDTQYLDCALNVNSLPTPFSPPAGKGPLWFIPGQSVTLMDQVTRAMGTYQIDANGFIIPQFQGGENLVIASLVAGQPWTMTVEPFAPTSQSGVDMHQRMTLRQISNIGIYIINSTGFLFQALFSAKQTPTSPALGAPQQYRRVPAWNQGDDATKPPPLRETVEEWPAPGSSYDPRVAIIKDTPGPLQILEIAMEVSI